jgi:hypothetical protein
MPSVILAGVSGVAPVADGEYLGAELIGSCCADAMVAAAANAAVARSARIVRFMCKPRDF